MAEIKTSKLMAKLIEAAQNPGNTKNPPFTAERFFVAVLDMMNTPTTEEEDGEIVGERNALADKVSQLVKDPKGARETLMAYICQVSSKSIYGK